MLVDIKFDNEKIQDQINKVYDLLHEIDRETRKLYGMFSLESKTKEDHQ